MSIGDGYVRCTDNSGRRRSIVNAANGLRGGRGVDAPFTVAGRSWTRLRKMVWGAGEAVFTPAFAALTGSSHRRACWHGGDRDEDRLLASCYRSSMELAHGHGIRSIAFPSISTGVYGFPVRRAAAIAIDTLRGMAIRYPEIRTVRMVTHGADTSAAYADELEATME